MFGFATAIAHLSAEPLTTSSACCRAHKRNSRLIDVYARFLREDCATTDAVVDLTLNLDNWTSISNQSVCAGNFCLLELNTMLWDVVDFTAAKHTGEQIAGEAFKSHLCMLCHGTSCVYPSSGWSCAHNFSNT